MSAFAPTTERAPELVTQAVAAGWNSLALERQDARPFVPPPSLKVTRYSIHRGRADKPFGLVDLGEITLAQVSENHRPGKLWTPETSDPLGFMHAFFTDVESDAWTKAPDQLVWRQAAEAATLGMASGRIARVLAGAVLIALAARCGGRPITMGEMP